MVPGVCFREAGGSFSAAPPGSAARGATPPSRGNLRCHRNPARNPGRLPSPLAWDASCATNCPTTTIWSRSPAASSSGASCCGPLLSSRPSSRGPWPTSRSATACESAASSTSATPPTCCCDPRASSSSPTSGNAVTGYSFRARALRARRRGMSILSPYFHRISERWISPACESADRGQHQIESRLWDVKTLAHFISTS